MYRDYIDLLLPMDDQPTDTHRKNMTRLREDMKRRYFDAPDLRHVRKNAYRFLNAISDFATHAKPLRETANYRENLFARTMEGNPLIDSGGMSRFEKPLSGRWRWKRRTPIQPRMPFAAGTVPGRLFWKLMISAMWKWKRRRPGNQYPGPFLYNRKDVFEQTL